jgi:hypothetical protein
MKKNTLQFITGQITNYFTIEIQNFLLADSKSAELKILASYWLAQGFDRFLRRISDAACCMRHQEGTKTIF